ncbi:flagellar basal-body rod protein FlgG [Acetivibrio clariflavus]|uniref:Flagellar basal-body rod protein FlgG n=1 Tax=Acetivibrio clariflavus (strain DSM 19732 / NBRC 101661 / EBR45) TaxID=720554 RepID=G8M1X4_ACECE|nr:flagellar basal-body rod protein FlgG [Acetivibrio clariflavus]AEV67057.1 flagellar basal-body rod protein FlgG [Acetivibrio clariflavus DSM 19732]
MMRALWTAGSGMKAQQFSVDVISNNLSNVNTTAYKKERAEFKDMLYETLNRATILEGEGRPVNLQVGHGASVVATVKNFETGSFEKTDNPLDFAIDGDGFFVVLGPRGDLAYTRDGSFKLSVTEDGNMLTTSDGYPVLDGEGSEIYLDFDLSKLIVSDSGELSYTDENGEVVSLGQRIGIVKFANRQGLESIGNNLYMSTAASGEAIPDEEMGRLSTVKQYFIEASNVQVVEEMVKLIIAQRAYEINSKAVQTADDMLGIANNLKR